MPSLKNFIAVNTIMGVIFAACFLITYFISIHHINVDVITTIAQTAVNTGATSTAVSIPIISAAKTGNLFFSAIMIFLVNSSIIAVMSGFPILNGVVLSYFNRTKSTDIGFLRTRMPKLVVFGIAVAIMLLFAKLASEFGWAYATSAGTAPFIMMEGLAVWIGAGIPIYTLYSWRPVDYGTFLEAFKSTANRKTGVLLLTAFLILAISAVLEVYTIYGVKVF